MKRFGNLVFIPGLNEGRYPYCNSLFVDDGEKAIIDPGSNEEILKELSRNTGMLLNTHYHEDHFTYNYLFPHARLHVHANEACCYESVRNILDFYGLLGGKYEKDWLDLFLGRFNYRERKPERKLADGEILQVGNTTIEVIHTPGHSPGHCSFWFPEEQVLFLGDLDMTRFGPWYGDRVSDIDQTIESVRKLMRIPARTFISAHETGVIEGDIAAMAEAYLDIISLREENLLKSLRRPGTLNDIVNRWVIYRKPREPLHFFEFGEEALVKKHLERLLRQKKVVLEEGIYRLM
ncbi:MAG: MBL fold metallo-hydrolase [Syntrophales bacterium]